MVTPKVSHFDEKIAIRVRDAGADAKVTLHAMVQRESGKSPLLFVSNAHYVTNQHGKLDLTTDISSGGTYTGMEAMGLFWSLQVYPPATPSAIFRINLGEDSVAYTLSIFQGHLSLEDIHAGSTMRTPCSSLAIQRIVRDPGVSRTLVRHGRLRGILFLPSGEGPHPAVLEIPGYGRGFMDFRAAMLASRGFAVMVLPWIAYDDLPETPVSLDLSYFEEAAQWLHDHPAVKKCGVGVVGVSAGGMYAKFAAVECSHIKAVATLNSVEVPVLFDLVRHGRLYRRHVLTVNTRTVHTEEGMVICLTERHSNQDIIPIWKSDAAVLAIVGNDDMYVNPSTVNEMQAMYPADRKHLLEVIRYPGLGHMVDPPYTPHCRACKANLRGGNVLWGGRPQTNAIAQEKSWRKIIQFFKTHLQ